MPLGKLLSLGLIFPIGLVRIVIALPLHNCFENEVRSCLQCAQSSVWHMTNRKSMSAWVIHSCPPLSFLNGVLGRARSPVQEAITEFCIPYLDWNQPKAAQGSLLFSHSHSTKLTLTQSFMSAKFSCELNTTPIILSCSQSRIKAAIIPTFWGGCRWLLRLNRSSVRDQVKQQRERLDIKDLPRFKVWLLTHVYAKGQ